MIAQLGQTGGVDLAVSGPAAALPPQRRHSCLPHRSGGPDERRPPRPDRYLPGQDRVRPRNGDRGSPRRRPGKPTRTGRSRPDRDAGTRPGMRRAPGGTAAAGTGVPGDGPPAADDFPSGHSDHTGPHLHINRTDQSQSAYSQPEGKRVKEPQPQASACRVDLHPRHRQQRLSPAGSDDLLLDQLRDKRRMPRSPCRLRWRLRFTGAIGMSVFRRC